MPVGVCVVGTFGVTMVLSQLYLPRHIGMASGLSVGLAMGIGGIAAVVLGAVADAVDLKTALTISAIAPALGVFVVPAAAAAGGAAAPRRRAGRGRLMLVGLGHLDLVCRDLDASLAFYAAVFGPLGLEPPYLVPGERGEQIHYLRFPQAARVRSACARRSSTRSSSSTRPACITWRSPSRPGTRSTASTTRRGGRRRGPACAAALAAVPPRVLRDVLPRPGRVPARGRREPRLAPLAERPVLCARRARHYAPWMVRGSIEACGDADDHRRRRRVHPLEDSTSRGPATSSRTRGSRTSCPRSSRSLTAIWPFAWRWRTLLRCARRRRADEVARPHVLRLVRGAAGAPDRTRRRRDPHLRAAPASSRPRRRRGRDRDPRARARRDGDDGSRRGRLRARDRPLPGPRLHRRRRRVPRR